MRTSLRGKDTADKDTVDKDTVDKDTVDKDTVDKDTVDKDTVDKNKPAQKNNNGKPSLISRMIPDPVESILKPEMNDSEQARILLITVSRQLFIALSCSVALGFIIINLVEWLGKTSNITLPIVMLCGIVGGFVGIQRRLKDLTIQDLKLLADSRIYLILAPFVGGVLALVLYLLFISQLLKGDLFPTFVADIPAGDEQITGFFTIFNQHAEPGFSGYAKLMFWCFLAGFSERFVTDVIGKFEGNAVKTIE